MRMLRGSTSLGLVLVLAALAGCGRKSAPTDTAAVAPDNKAETATPKSKTASKKAATPSVSGTLELFVPCAFNPPSVKIIQAFKEKYPGVEVTKQVENVEVLAPRIEKGAKPDVFLCVGDIEMDRLQKAGLVADRKDFCFVGLALVVHENNPLKIKSLTDLTKSEVKSIGVGADNTSPGHYAVEVLKEKKLWDKVSPKVVRPKFPSQLLKLTGGLNKVDASFAYGACLRAGHGEWKEQNEYAQLSRGLSLVLWLDEGEFCQSIPCPAATITGCENPEAGKAFVDFLRTAEAQEYFRKSGFTRLDESKCFK